jgi:hypothetical protein
MDVEEDADRVAASLAGCLERLTFVDLPTGTVTEQIIETVVAWASGQGWRVYRRATSVLPLPPPMSRQKSVLDVACARPDGPPLAVEVDHTDRRRTVEKLLAEAQAGRIPLWVRWGTGGFVAPPRPVRMIPYEVTRRPGRTGQGWLYSRTPTPALPPPAHSTDGVGDPVVEALPFPAP